MGRPGSAASTERGRKPSSPSVLVLALGIVLLAPSPIRASQAPPSGLDDLIDKATRQGALRVIVEVLPEGPAPYSREAIAKAQDLVMQELGGTTHRILRRYTTMPFMGLAVSADALRRLGGSLYVGSIREDTLLRPQGSPASP